jgi:hypothetical protein
MKLAKVSNSLKAMNKEKAAAFVYATARIGLCPSMA